MGLTGDIMCYSLRKRSVLNAFVYSIPAIMRSSSYCCLSLESLNMISNPSVFYL